MNLVKKILTTGLACFFLNGFGIQKTFSKDNIIEEKEKYETLFLCNYGYLPEYMNSIVSLGWDTNEDGKEDFRGLYTISGTSEQNVFDLGLVGTEKRNPTNGGEINQDKYAKFLLGINKGSLILGWYKWENSFCVEKLYYYKSVGLDENKNVVNKIEAIQKDTNGDRMFRGNEFLYKKKLDQ